MFLPVSLSLWLALLGTAGLLFAVHRRLQSAGADLAEYRRALADVVASLSTAEDAVRRMTSEGRDVAIVLADRVAAAEAMFGRPNSIERNHERKPDGQ